MIAVDNLGRARRAPLDQQRSIKEIVRTLSSRATVRKMVRGQSDRVQV